MGDRIMGECDRILGVGGLEGRPLCRLGRVGKNDGGGFAAGVGADGLQLGESYGSERASPSSWVSRGAVAPGVRTG